MGAVPPNAFKCGCDMIGEGTRQQSRRFRGVMWTRMFVVSHESPRSHWCLYWWCNDCREAHWRCAVTKKGRCYVR